MSYPPSSLPARTDVDPAAPNSHSADHTAERAAVNTIVTELGTTPKGAYGDLSARLTAIEGADTSEASSRIAGDALALAKASNLSDLANATTARTNLGLAALAASGSATDLSTGTVPVARLPLVTATTAGASKKQPRFITTPAGWDDAWVAAKAAQASTPAWISFPGTSITAGQGSTNWISNGWVGRLKTTLLGAGNSLYADYYPISYSATLNASVGSPSPWSSIKAATSHTEYQAGFTLAEGVTTTGSADQYTFSSPYACTRLDYWYIDYASGTFDIKIDGGAAQTTTNTGPSNAAGAVVKKVSFTGLSNATHTLSIGNSNGGNVIMILGVACFASTTGIGFARHGLPGLAAVNLATPAGAATGSGGVGSWPADKIGLHSGSTIAGFPTQPALAIIELSVNDATYGMNVEAYRWATSKLVQALRKGYTNCSIIFLLPAYPYNLYADTNIGGRPYHHLRIKAVVEAVAQQFNCAVVDIDTKWGETPFGQGFMPNNDIHPLDAGHTDIADALATII